MAKFGGAFKWAKEAVLEQLFTNALGGVWKTATGTLTGMAGDKFKDMLSHKGMRDNALAMENVGRGMDDNIDEDTELQYLFEALVRAKRKCKTFMRNIILVLGWPIEEELEAIKKDKKDEDLKDKIVSGLTRKLEKDKAKEKGKKPKWPPRIRALCKGAESAKEVYCRMEAFGLIDEAPDGKLDEIFLKFRKELPEKWKQLNSELEKTAKKQENKAKKELRDFNNRPLWKKLFMN